MTEIREAQLPETALLQSYAAQPGCYTDAYTCSIPIELSLWDYVEAFYSTRLFKAEKILLRLAIREDETNWDPTTLRKWGRHFAAWMVEEQTDNELLMCDVSETTRSWFRVDKTPNSTELYFGSAIVPKDGANKPPVVARALIMPHKVYSKALLRATARTFEV